MPKFFAFMEVFESVQIRPDPDPGGPKAKQKLPDPEHRLIIDNYKGPHRTAGSLQAFVLNT
jgi:hypothetical protein